MSTFTFDQEKTFRKIEMLKEAVGEIDLTKSNCPLLQSELAEVALLSLMLRREILKLQEKTK